MGKIESDDPNRITEEIIAAEAQVSDIVEIKKHDGTVLWRLDKDGGFTWDSYAEPADYVVWYTGSKYKVKSCSENKTVVSEDTYDAAIAAMEALSGFSTGNWLVVDKAFYSTRQLWHYRLGKVHAPELKVQQSFDWKPRRIFSLFDGGAGVEWLSDSGHYGDETSNYLWGDKGIWLHAHPVGSGHYIHKTFSPTIDCSEAGGEFRLRMYVNTRAELGNIWFRVCSGGWPTNVASYYAGSFNRVAGWQEFILPRKAFTTDVGTVDWSAISDIYMLIGTQTANDDGNWILNYLGWNWSDLPRCTLIIGTDDIDGDTVPNTWLRKGMEKYGWRGHAMMTQGTINGNPTSVQRLHDAGWDICFHGWEHDDWGTKTHNQMARDMIRWLRLCSTLGVLDKWRIAGSPGGGTQWDTSKWLAQYFHWNRGGQDLWYENCFPFSDFSFSTLYTPTNYNLAQAKSWIDQIESYNRLAICLFHGVPYLGTWTQADVDEWLAYIASKNIEVLNFSELLTRYGKLVKT